MYRIYLADDETWVVIGLKKQIEKSGLPFQVIGEANNGVAAMEEILEKKPDILITDIRMPGLNGLQLLEKLREKGIAVKVIFISGYAEFEYAQSALRMGSFDYLLKPVEQEKLNQVLIRLLAAFRRERGEEEETAPEEPINSSMMNQIIREIQERYTENITLSGLAEAHGISTGYLSSQLKAELGLSFSKTLPQNVSRRQRNCWGMKVSPWSPLQSRRDTTLTSIFLKCLRKIQESPPANTGRICRNGQIMTIFLPGTKKSTKIKKYLHVHIVIHTL